MANKNVTITVTCTAKLPWWYRIYLEVYKVYFALTKTEPTDEKIEVMAKFILDHTDIKFSA